MLSGHLQGRVLAMRPLRQQAVLLQSGALLACKPGCKALWLPALEKREPAVNAAHKRRIFDLIREAVIPEFRDRVDEYLELYETTLQAPATGPADCQAIAQQLRGYLRGLNTTRVLGMADWEELDRRVVELWLV